MDQVGLRIKQIRKDHKLTQEQFGQRIGIKDSAISMLERSERSLTESVVKNILNEFCVNELWLKEGIGEKYNLELRKNKDLLDNKLSFMSPSLINGYLSLQDKLENLCEAERTELLKTFDTLLTALCTTDLKAEKLNSFLESIAGKDKISTDDEESTTNAILSDEEKELLDIYRDLDAQDREEALSFLKFKNTYKNECKKKQKLSISVQDKKAEAIHSKIG